jgi:hypothetical protein
MQGLAVGDLEASEFRTMNGVLSVYLSAADEDVQASVLADAVDVFKLAPELLNGAMVMVPYGGSAQGEFVHMLKSLGSGEHDGRQHVAICYAWCSATDIRAVICGREWRASPVGRIYDVFETVARVGGQDVTIRGQVIDGQARVGTALVASGSQ